MPPVNEDRANKHKLTRADLSAAAARAFWGVQELRNDGCGLWRCKEACLGSSRKIWKQFKVRIRN